MMRKDSQFLAKNSASNVPSVWCSLALLLSCACNALIAPAAFSADKVRNYVTKTEADFGYNRLSIPTAIQTTVVFKTPIDSRKTLDGARIEALLKEDLIVNDIVIAPQGSRMIGHVEYIRHARRMTESALAIHGRFKQGAALKVIFTKIATTDGETIYILGRLSQQSATLSIDGGRFDREVSINKDGAFDRAEEVLTSQDKILSGLIGQGVSTVLTPLGSVASFGALPVAMGILGAAEPSLMTNKPVGMDDKHVRIKGFTLGVVESLPAGQLMVPFIVKGSELRIKQGDEYLVQVHSPYTAKEKLTAQMQTQSVDGGISRPVPTREELKVLGEIRHEAPPVKTGPTAPLPGKNIQ
jgi:hypothetical protein